MVKRRHLVNRVMNNGVYKGGGGGEFLSS